LLEIIESFIIFIKDFTVVDIGVKIFNVSIESYINNNSPSYLGNSHTSYTLKAIWTGLEPVPKSLGDDGSVF